MAAGSSGRGSGSSRARGGEDPAAAEAAARALREGLERSVTLSRDRLQETVDDAVRRGRLTRDDANELVSRLVSRGRSYRDDLLGEVEALLAGARQGAQDAATSAERNVRSAAGRASRTARDLADEPLRRADQARRRVGAPGGPITGYERLTAAQVRSRIPELSREQLRAVRDQERRGRARKTILAAIDRRLG